MPIGEILAGIGRFITSPGGQAIVGTAFQALQRPGGLLQPAPGGGFTPFFAPQQQVGFAGPARPALATRDGQRPIRRIPAQPGAAPPKGYHLSLWRTARAYQPGFVRNRRMRPTNTRALRRAVRRARGFRRLSAKVNSLFPARRMFTRGRRGPRRRSYRGDIVPFEHDGAINPYAAEDFAEYLDEAEDLGIPFPDEELEEAME